MKWALRSAKNGDTDAMIEAAELYSLLATQLNDAGYSILAAQWFHRSLQSLKKKKTDDLSKHERIHKNLRYAKKTLEALCQQFPEAAAAVEPDVMRRA